MVEIEEKKSKVDYSKLNIFQKMSLATSKIETVIKGLTVGEGKNSYKAVSDKDVNNAVKPIETELGIYSYPFDRKVKEETRETFVTKYGSSINFVIKLETIYRFINVDKPEEFIDIKTYGYGIDSQDKAPGKAMTYSDKYALLKAYKIETGDDPDQKNGEEIITEITEEYAKNYKLTFGKNNGKTLGQLLITDRDYLDWLYSNERTDQHIKDCIKLLYEKIPKQNEEEQKEILSLITKSNMLFDITDTDREKVYEYYKVKSNSEMTLEQLRELVNVLEKRQK